MALITCLGLFFVDGTMICYNSSYIYLWYVAFKALGKLIFDIGLMLAYHCDQYGKTTIDI